MPPIADIVPPIMTVPAASGFPVQPAIQIPANSLNVSIARDGVVSVTRQGQTAPTQVGTTPMFAVSSMYGQRSDSPVEVVISCATDAMPP